MKSTIHPSELLAHMDWVQRLARQLVPSPEQAADLAQDTWLTALSQPPEHAGNLRSWLGSVLRNRARSTGRAESSRLARERGVAQVEGSTIVEQASVQHEVVEVVLALDEPYRTLLLLRYFENRSVREIASEQGVAVNTVRSQLVRGHGQVREALDRRYASEGGRKTWAGLLLGDLGRAAAETALVVPHLAMALAAVVLLGGGAAWWALGSERPKLDAAELDVGAGLERHGEAAGLVGSFTGASAERLEAGAADDGGDEPAGAKDGSILLEVLDEESGQPLSELAFLVYEEGAGKNLLAQGRTDARGRARVAGMPLEDVLIVRTERQVPHAPSFGAIWLASKKPKSLTLRVGAGSSVTGRVVDELGTPLAGMEVRGDGRAEAGLNFNSGSASSQWSGLGYAGGSGPPASIVMSSSASQLLAVSDEEGRWRVEHLASMPRGVWIVDDMPRPQGWEPVKLTLLDPRFKNRRSDQIEFGVARDSELDLGDTVLLRTVTFAGRVVDSQGQPVPDVLVLAGELHTWRFVSRLSYADAIRQGLTRPTTKDGRFEVQSMATRGGNTLYALPPTGSLQHFQVAKDIAPGTRIENLELSLRPQSAFHVNLRTPAGDRLETKSDEELEITIGLRDGQRHGLRWVPADGGSVRCFVDASLDELASIEVVRPGCMPRWLPFEQNGSTDSTHEVVLTPLPRLELRSQVPWTKAAGSLPATLRLRQHSLQGRIEAPQLLYAGTEKLSIPVSEPGPYWVEIVQTRGGEILFHRGPFEADQGPFDLKISAAEWASAMQLPRQVAKPIPATTDEQPALGHGPSDRAPDGQSKITLRVLDATSGMPLPLAETWVRYRDTDSGGHRQRSFFDIEDQVMVVRCSAGLVALQVSCAGYETPVPSGEFQIKAGESIDLGSLYLTRLPELSCLLRNSDGAPLEKFPIQWFMDEEEGRATSDANGHIRLTPPRAGIIPMITQQGFLPGGDAPLCFVNRPDLSTPEELVFDLVKQVHVTVELSGLTPIEFFEIESAFLRGNEGKPQSMSAKQSVPLRMAASPDGRLRRFEGFAPSGTYTFSVLHIANGTIRSPITVVADLSAQTFSITVR